MNAATRVAKNIRAFSANSSNEASKRDGTHWARTSDPRLKRPVLYH